MMYNPYTVGMPPQMTPNAPFSPMGYSYPQPQSTQQTTLASNMDWIRVNVLGDVQNVTVQPGQKAWIMLANDPVFALKTADNMGITTTEFYRFERYNPESPKSEYVTREEFEAFVAQFSAPKKEALK